MDQTKREYSSRVQIALLSFSFSRALWGVYLEEFEPAQILITIDSSWNSHCRSASYSWTLIDSLMLLNSLTFVDSSFLPGSGITNWSLSPDRIISNNVLIYLLKINVTSSSLSMHVNFATRIAAGRSLLLLTMTIKAFCSQDIPTDWLWGTIYFMILSSVLSVYLIL